MRTRQIFTNRIVAKVWAEQSQSYARNHNNSFYVRDKEAFSYGGRIANIVTNARGRQRVLLLAGNYRNATNGHIWRCRQNIDDGTPKFSVPQLDATDRAHAENINYLRAQYQQHFKRLMHSKADSWLLKTDGDYHSQGFERLSELSATLVEYAEAFNLKVDAPTPKKDWDTVLARKHRIQADPKRNQHKLFRAIRIAMEVIKASETKLGTEGATPIVFKLEEVAGARRKDGLIVQSVEALALALKQIYAYHEKLYGFRNIRRSRNVAYIRDVLETYGASSHE